MAGKKGQKKRLWSDDEKRSICEQTLPPGISVAQVARRYSMNANLIFKWLRDPRYAPSGRSPAGEDAAFEGVFLPVEVGAASIESAASTQTSGAAENLGAAVSALRMDITLSDGRRILVEGSTALSESSV